MVAQKRKAFPHPSLRVPVADGEPEEDEDDEGGHDYPFDDVCSLDSG